MNATATATTIATPALAQPLGYVVRWIDDGGYASSQGKVDTIDLYRSVRDAQVDMHDSGKAETEYEVLPVHLDLQQLGKLIGFAIRRPDGEIHDFETEVGDIGDVSMFEIGKSVEDAHRIAIGREVPTGYATVPVYAVMAHANSTVAPPQLASPRASRLKEIPIVMEALQDNLSYITEEEVIEMAKPGGAISDELYSFLRLLDAFDGDVRLWRVQVARRNEVWRLEDSASYWRVPEGAAVSVERMVDDGMLDIGIHNQVYGVHVSEQAKAALDADREKRAVASTA